MASETTRARTEAALRNTEVVLAESALIGERKVAWVRLGLAIGRPVLLSLAVAASGLPPPSGTELAVRIGINGFYLLFAVVLLIGLRRATPRPERGVYAPLIMAAVDFGMVLANAWVTARLTPAGRGLGNGMLENVSSMVLIGFALARYGRIHLLVSTALACVTTVLVGHWSHTLNLFQATFACVSFIALGLLMAWFNLDIRQMFVNLRRRDAFSRFLPAQVVDRLARLGDLAFEPVKRQVTILFSDIRDFTALSETQDPRTLLHFLDEYFADMSQVVKGHEGMVNKFIGDGLMAVWGVPDATDDHAERALSAALDMRRKLEELNAHRSSQGQPAIRIGIGLHSGAVAAGMLGGAEQHEYTVIGDAVNVASRIEGLTKLHGCDILASESTWTLAGSKFQGVRVGEQQVKGRQEPVVVYRLDGRVAISPVSVFPTAPARAHRA